MTNQLMSILSTILPLVSLTFNIILLVVIIHNRKNNSIPLAYITVMSINGIVISLFVSLHLLIYLVLSDATYSEYLVSWGRETTLGGTFSYLNYLLVSVLMTINRVVVVAKPFNEWFTHTKVFVYCGIISIITFISLLIPYFSPCYVIFDVNRLSFVSGCAPKRHPITLFQNTYAFFLPMSCMFVNLGIIFYLRLSRNHFYSKLFKRFFGKNQVTADNQGNFMQSTTLSKIQERREFIMMKQSIIVAVYLSIYEFGGLIVRFFPEYYMSMPQNLRDFYFYFRLESVPLMNFVIYYVETESVRKIVRRFFNLKTDSVDSVMNGTAPAIVSNQGLLKTATGNGVGAGTRTRSSIVSHF